MKKIMMLITTLVLVSCMDEQFLCTEDIILPEDRASVQECIIKIMDTIKVTSRGEDEDWEEFIYEGKKSCFEMYRKVGIGWSTRNIADCIVTNY